MYDLDPWVLGRKSISNLSGSVTGTIIHNYPLSRFYRLHENGLNGGFDVLFLVPNGSDNDVPRIHRLSFFNVAMKKLLRSARSDQVFLPLLRRVSLIR
jgi:hypothetical protein